MSARKLSLWMLVLAYLLMLWVAASFLSRRHGIVYVLPGIFALIVSLLAFRRRQPRLLYGLFLGMLLVTITALGTELVLHEFPGILKGEAANIVYSGYYWQRGGIYIPDLHLGNRMRPNFRRRMYWQDHWWKHETNGDAYRGPKLSHADAVFLGDSMIYGHGVEESQTVPAQFSRESGLTAANLGQQGTCMIQSLILLEEKGIRLKPKYVFVCSHPTDLDDLTFWYEPEELRMFLANESYLPMVRDEFRPRSLWNLSYLWSAYVALPLRSSGVAGALSKTLRTHPDGAEAKNTANYVPAEADLNRTFAPDPLQWDVHQQAILRMKRLCQKNGCELILFDIGYPKQYTEAIENFARSAGIRFSPAGRAALQQALDQAPVYLANDGHWTPQGSEIVARELLKSR